MKLLMTADTVGGVWSYALELARALAPHAVHVHLATMGARPSAAQRAEAALLENLTLHESTYRLEWMQDAWDDVAAAGEWLLELERATVADVVHSNGFAHAALPFRAPVLLGAHSCVCSWWRAVHGEAAPEAQWREYRAAVQAGLSAAQSVVAPTRALLDAMAVEHGAIANATVVPNARVAAEYLPGPKQQLILGAGRLWDPSKNVAALRTAATDVAWPILVAGAATSPEGKSFDTSPLTTLGTLAAGELAAWFSRASIFASPALYEPFGLTALEAALAGCALVLSDIPTFREVWGDAALYVPARDPAALARTLDLLVQQPQTLLDMASRARVRALRYQPRRMAAAYLSLYTQLAGTGRKAALCA